MLFSLATFFIALFMKDSLSGISLLIFPSSLLGCLLFFGYFRTGTIIGAFKDIIIIIFVLVVLYVVLAKLPAVTGIFSK